MPISIITFKWSHDPAEWISQNFSQGQESENQIKAILTLRLLANCVICSRSDSPSNCRSNIFYLQWNQKELKKLIKVTHNLLTHNS